jgi:3-methyladenine DNA glycosylase AlkC
MSHPIERFRAPRSITAGTPLKRLLSPGTVRLIADSLTAADPTFDATTFVAEASRGLASLELKPRAAHIADALARLMPQDPEAAATLLIASLGPPLTTTAGYGLRPFFYLPHSTWIHRHLNAWEPGLRAIRALTTRFTGEFAIRPFLQRERDRTLALLHTWTADPNPHVRRLVSEGTRPRLPWAERVPALMTDPTCTVPLLERLVDDPDLYVRRSVANHVGDLAKDHPQAAFALCARWLEGAGPERRWLIRHALRHPANHGVAAARRLRLAAGNATP